MVAPLWMLTSGSGSSATAFMLTRYIEEIGEARPVHGLDEHHVAEKLPQIAVPTLATGEVQPHVPGAIEKTNPGMPDMGYQPIEAVRANAAEIAAFLDP